MYFIEGQLDPFEQKLLQNSQVAPMKTYPALVEIRSATKDTSRLSEIEGDSSRPEPSPYWSWTFGFTTFPFIFWGCPIHALTSTPYQITSTGGWLKRIFDFHSFPGTTILSIILVVPTILLNVYIFYVLGDMFYSLFISGEYKISFLTDFVQVVRYVPVLIPLDYVWLRGYSVSNMIRLLNHLHGKYGAVGCASFRIKLVLMLVVILGVQIIRYVVYDRYEVTARRDFWTALENAFEFSLDVYLAFLLPLYCTFCYSIRYQLYVVQGFLYKLIRERVRPNIGHLSKVKTLFTLASDHILMTNSFFSLYLSVALVIMIVGTVFDAGNMWEALLKISGGGMLAGILAMIVAIGKETGFDVGDTGNGTEVEKFTPEQIREINFDVACVILTYGLIFYTVWQAVGTNDCVRELHVWLNDFVTGGGGTDVQGVLENLGMTKKKRGFVSCRRHEAEDEVGEQEEDKQRELEESRRDFFLQDLPLLWARNTLLDGGMTDEFIKKYRNLKAFIHVRMQTEKPALLNIALLIILAPPLSSRLRGYRIVF